MSDISRTKRRIKTLNLVYWVQGVFQLIIGVVVYLTITGKPDYTTAIFFQKILLTTVPLLMGTGYFLYRYQIGKLDMKLSLEEKVQRYVVYILARTAFFEVAFLFCCISAFQTSVQLFLWIAPVPFLLFLLLRPNPGDMKIDLRLTEAEANQLEQ
jgi:hypothetical protein